MSDLVLTPVTEKQSNGRRSIPARRKLDASLIDAAAPPVDAPLALLSAKGLRAKFAPALRHELVVRVDPDSHIRDDVEHLGGRVVRDAGPVRTVILPPPAVTELCGMETIQRVRLQHRLTPKLDEVAALHDFRAYRDGLGLEKRRGDGVLIGIIDSGVSGAHPAFRDRIVECWDQTVKGKGAGEFDYGAVLKAAQSIDKTGHGTHVAGIAAGDDDPYCGVAPKARILAVRTDFQETHVHDAVAYVFRRAEELGMKAVVNLSLGGHGDPHDGTDDLDRIVDFESGPGRIIVAAAGNEGGDNIHTRMELQHGEERTVGFRVPPLTDRIRLNIWYSGEPAEIAVSTPTGVSTPYHLPQDDRPHSYQLGSSGRVVLSTPERDPSNGDYQVRLRIDSSTAVQADRWFLHVRAVNGPIDLHAWSIDESGTGADVTFSTPVNSHLIGSPGAARNAITVAAYTSKNRWTASDGMERTIQHRLKEVAPFSSPGPLRRNNHSKPDFAAAGATIVSCRSASAHYDVAELVDDHHVAMGGTSMACAVISGLVATMLEENPNWAAADAVEALKRWTRGTYSPVDGFGLVTAKMSTP